jgi:hypothetical protein
MTTTEVIIKVVPAEPQPAPPSGHICQTGDCGLEPCVDLPVHRDMPGGRGVRTVRTLRTRQSSRSW